MDLGDLVGRERELATLDGCVATVADGESAVLLVVGEAGIGKTSLLNRLRTSAGPRFAVVAGRATELERDVPLALFDGTDLLPPAPPDDRADLARSISSAVLERGHRRPVAILLDDVHWADVASLELVQALLTRPPRTPHLLAAFLRPGPVVDILARTARSAGRPVEHLEVGPLTRDSARLLADRGGAPHLDIERLVTQSGGNPLLLTELSRATAGPHAHTGRPHVPDRRELPTGIVASVEGELEQLSPPARELVSCGALLGDPFDLELARAVSGLSRDETGPAVDELVAVRLVRPTTALSRLEFRHPVVRTAVNGAMPLTARLDRHARAAEVLTDAGAPTPAVAHHLVHVASPGDTNAAATLRMAAAAVRTRAPSVAADWFLAAQRCAPATDVEAFADLTDVLLQSGRVEEALETADDGLAHAGGDPAERLRLDLLAARVERVVGRHEASHRRLQRALEGDPPERMRLDLLVGLASSAFDQGDFGEAARIVAEADQAVQAVLSVGSVGSVDSVESAGAGAGRRVARAAVAAFAAMVARIAGDIPESERRADEAMALVGSAQDDELAADAELLILVPWSLVQLDRLDDALLAGRRGAGAARAAGNEVVAVILALPEALVLGLQGRLAEAIAASERTVLEARLTHVDQALQLALWLHAWLLVDGDRLEEGLAAATESVRIAEGLEDSVMVTAARSVLGSSLIVAGRAEEGVPLLAAHDGEPSWICRWSPRLVEGYLALGDVAGAVAAAQRAVALDAVLGLRGTSTAVHRALALVALSHDDLDVALAEGEAALDAARALGMRHDESQALVLCARARRDAEPERAADELDEAYRLATRLGQSRTARQAARELRRLGRRIGSAGRRSAEATGVGSLTVREREIADLVAAGHTNREIAARLYLSDKTVEAHLSRAFAKLGVRSRAAVAAAVAAAVPSG